MIYVWHTKISVNKTPPTQIEVIDLRRSTTYGEEIFREFERCENRDHSGVVVEKISKLVSRYKYLKYQKALSNAKVQILSKCVTHSTPSLLFFTIYSHAKAASGRLPFGSPPESTVQIQTFLLRGHKFGHLYKGDTNPDICRT